MASQLEAHSHRNGGPWMWSACLISSEFSEMKCQHCGLVNPDGAVRCDCGYDFVSRTLKDSYLPVVNKAKPNRRQSARQYAISCGIATLAEIVLLETRGIGEATFTPGLRFAVAVRMLPGVGAHDSAFLLLWVITFVTNAALYGFVVFGAWRALKSLFGSVDRSGRTA